MIETLPKPVRDYLASFNLGCIVVSPTGEILVLGVQELARMSSIAALWWTKDRAAAHQVVRAIGEQRPSSVETAVTEIRAAAARVDTVLSEHDMVLDRAQAAIGKLDARLGAAQQAGALKGFNRAYKAYRLDCVARGTRAMPYNVALARLRALLAGAAAGAPTANMIQAVFKPSAP